MFINKIPHTISFILASTLLMACKPAAESDSSKSPAAQSKQPEAQQSNRDEANLVTLQGKVWYRERIILPDTAHLEIYLEDVAKMDIASTVIASKHYENLGSPPWSFELEYDSSLLNNKGRYVIRARVMEGKRLRFINTQLTEAFPDANRPVKVLVQHVATESGAQSAKEGDKLVPSNTDDSIGDPLQQKDPSSLSALPLTSSRWLITQLNGIQKQISVSDAQGNLIIDEKKQRIAGSSGCNIFNGSYQLDGDKITIGPLISTRMACHKDVMKVEQEYLDAIQKVRFYQRQGNNLTLYDQQKNVLVILEEKSAAAP